MAGSRKVWELAVVALVVSAGARRAAAADVAPNVYPVEIVGEGGARSIRLSGREPVYCGRECALDVLAGRYRVFVTDDDGHEFSQVLDVRGPTRVTVAPGSQRARVAGGAMFGVGLVSLFAGAGMLSGFVVEGLCMPADCDPHRDRLLIAGAITLSAGIALTAAGSRMWRGRGRAHISDAPASAPPPSAARWRLTPAAGLRWTGLALAGSF